MQTKEMRTEMMVIEEKLIMVKETTKIMEMMVKEKEQKMGMEGSDGIEDRETKTCSLQKMLWSWNDREM